MSRGASTRSSDAETIETELMLADLDSLERRLPQLEKKLRGQDKEAKKTLELVERVLPLLREGKPARLGRISDDEERRLQGARPAHLEAGALCVQCR